MRIALIIVGALVVIVALVVTIGALLPMHHVAERELTVPGTPAQIFALITSPADYPSWRPEVSRVEMIASSDDSLQYREVSSHGSITYHMNRSTLEHDVTTTITDRKLPFGGKWTYSIRPAGTNSARVSIREDGEVYNVVFRFVARFIMGYTSTIDRYLNDLAHAATGSRSHDRR